MALIVHRPAVEVLPMESTTVAIVFAVTAFAVFGVLYAIYGARRGKASGHTDRTWCMPQGHGDIDARTEAGREIAPRDTCPPVGADARDRGPADESGRVAGRDRELVR
jgi:hypothetical protein